MWHVRGECQLPVAALRAMPQRLLPTCTVRGAVPKSPALTKHRVSIPKHRPSMLVTEKTVLDHPTTAGTEFLCPSRTLNEPTGSF